MNFKEITAKAPRNSEVIAKGSLDVLKTSGELNYGVQLAKDDLIEFPKNWDEVSSRVSTMNNGSLAYHLLVGINGEQRYIPLGSFRRRPIDHEEVLKNATVNQTIIDCDHDHARVELMFGKTLKVADIVDGKFPRFKKGEVLYDEQGNQLTRLQKIPIFEIVE